MIRYDIKLGFGGFPLIPALRRPRQVYLYEFEVSLVYRAGFRMARAEQQNPVLKTRHAIKINLLIFLKYNIYIVLPVTTGRSCFRQTKIPHCFAGNSKH